ncbi:MAG: phage minor capsid protein [Ruminococcus sp.]|nr:phage minor capsid protein [Ruminococcus sp.]
MLTPDYYDKCTKQLVELYAELDNAIISDITRRLLKNGEMTETAKWQAKQLQEAGKLYDEILTEVGNASGKSQDEIRRIFEDAGVTATKNDNVFAKAAGYKEIRTFSKAALQTLNAGYEKCAGDMSNLTLTTANTSQQLYINAVNNAYMQITSGAFDYNTAIRNAVKAAAAEGSEVMYPSGHTDKLDVAVRRSVLTGVGQTCRKLSEINAQDMGTDLMEITAHSGARPSHAEWQGKVVSLSGRKGYLSKSDIGYGTGDGFGGWNCRHDWYPFFEGISTRAYTEERLEELNSKNIEYNGEKYSQYEISQMQRKMERDIRQLKREAIAADTGAKNAANEELAKQFSNDFTITSVKLKEQEKKLKEFLNETGQLPDGSRVWSNGFDKSISQKAVHANKKAHAQSSLFSSMLEEYNNGQKDTIKFKSIEKELNKSEIGRDYLEYFTANPCKINLYYNVDVDNDLLGTYDPLTDEISIYASNTKTIRRTSEVIIHELTHRRYEIGDSYWSESVCRAHEYMHRNRRNNLTIQEKRIIIKEIKETYSILNPDWKWR